MPAPPPTAYPPGTKLTVGSHEAEIVDFIGMGGFAHVYTVRTSPPTPGQDLACLKRVQVPDKAYLNLLRAEVDAMQRLRGASNVVQYFDSHAERMHPAPAANAPGGPIAPAPPGAGSQYEVFLLMEFCERGGLIDFMNTRLRDQLREHEILKIMYDITLGLSHMHYLQPPLLHRDLKIENVLISASGDFKLCDFGSVSPVLSPPKTPQEYKILEDDIQHHTTVQYRAPEMIDIGLGYPIDEKSDIWALGIFLYKLCFYTTPFERPNQTLEQFQQLILTSQYTMPPRPAYSDRLRNMIFVLLQPNPRMRPNVFQVLQEICSMRHVDVPIKDIYRPQGAVPAPVPGAVPQAMPQAVPPVGSVPGGVPGGVQGTIPNMRSGIPVPGAASAPIPAGAPAPRQFAPGVGYAPPRTLTAPGKVAVPGVLLTSPPIVPASPERSVSPVDNLSSRFPSLEELDRMPSLSRSKSSGSQTMAKPTQVAKPPVTKPVAKPSVAKPPLAKPAPGTKPAVARAQTSPKGKPAKPAKPPGLKDPAARPESLGVTSDAAKLKQILTGISGRPSTVIMDKEPESNLSSVDFLRSLNPPEKRHHHHHKTTAYDSGGLAYESDEDEDGDDSPVPYTNAFEDDLYVRESDEYDETGDYEPDYEPDADYEVDGVYEPSDDYVEEITDPEFEEPPRPVKPAKPGDKPLKSPLKPMKPAKPALLTKDRSPLGHSRSVPDISRPELEPAPVAKPGKPVVTAGKPGLPELGAQPELVGKPPARSATANAAADAAKQSEAPPAVPRRSKPRPKSANIGQTVASTRAGELDSFKPTNVIQQRVYEFLNSHDREHPPPRTATGYGRFTEEDEPRYENLRRSVPDISRTKI